MSIREPYHFDREGNPLTDLMEWGRLHMDIRYKTVAKAVVGEARVSTVWLGYNYQFGDGPPLIFETMIFGGPRDDETWRYPTEDEARVGHQRVVDELVNETGAEARDTTEEEIAEIEREIAGYPASELRSTPEGG